MQARIRDYEEILILQDKAIEALKQATTVLQQALYVLEKARKEHGYQNQMPWNQYPGQTYYPYSEQPQQPYVFYSNGLGGLGGNAMLTSNTAKENFDYVPETIFKY